jgi:histidinol dehydrogenase
MRSERGQLTGDEHALAVRLRALVPAPESVDSAVADIIAAVRAGGDEALNEYTRALDTEGADPPPLAVADHELQVAAAALDPAVRAGLQTLIDNVRRVAQLSLDEDRTAGFGSHRVAVRSTPVDRAAVYVPGGRAPYPSTVVMGVVTARVAGVREVVVCSPPGGDDADVPQLVLGACGLTEVSGVYRMGGAQAIAALAYGTESVGAVDVIAGPGNLYVQEAKRQVSGHVGIDGFAGPSDLVVAADADVDPELVTLDLLAQAEHGAGTLVLAVSTSAALLDAVQARIDDASDTGAIAAFVEVSDPEQALALSQALAPEHLELIGSSFEPLAPRATHAGCLFVGRGAATAFGDYVAGSNHILPTNGAARFASALSPAQFRRRYTEVSIEDPSTLAPAAAPIARAEGFEIHARSMEARIRENH